jgi:N-hydroxyarylamine O-acetyltransferase
MNIDAYLKRINYQGARRPTAVVLRDLQTAHMQAVPFENLSIHSGQPIILEVNALFDKIVRRRRGGFCYENNGLFAALLRQLGFDVSLLAAGVIGPDGEFGPEFDHMTLMVKLEERWLVDVGFGDSFPQPLRLDERGDQPQGRRVYRITADGDHFTLWQREPLAAWSARYRFTLQPRAYADYTEMCHYHQTSPHSPFTQRRVCSRATADGRLTLSDLRLITTTLAGERQEQPLASEAEFTAVLRDQFGIVMTN